MLGDFDTKQMFSGYVDELRIWDTIRTAEEIEAWRNLTLPGGRPTNCCLAGFPTGHGLMLLFIRQQSILGFRVIF